MTRSARRTVAVLLALAAAPCDPLSAQQRGSVRMLGVFDDASGEPVIGAEVVDLSTGTKAVTSSTGAISLAWLGPGTTFLEIRKVGYANQMIPVTVSAADTASLTVILRSSAQQLPEVVTKAAAPVTGKMSAFEERRHVGIGHFLTREQIAKFDGMLTENAMRMVPGAMISHGQTYREAYVYTVRGGRGGSTGKCLATVVLDGAIVSMSSPFNINSLTPDEIEGIEFYASGATVPVQYNATGTGCGLVVIWTR